MGRGGEDESVPLLLRLQEGGRASAKKTFGNIFVSIVGSGVLGLPYTFKISGWVVASASVIIASALTYYCMMLLVQCRNKIRNDGHLDYIDTYGDLGHFSYGAIGKNAVDVMVTISQCGCCVAYLIFIGQNLSSIFYGDASQQRVVILILIPIQIALAWVRSLSGLAPFSILADICSILAMAVVIKDDFKDIRGFQNTMPVGQWESIPFAMGIAIYCYEGFGMTLSIEASMKNRNKFGSVLGAAFFLITTMYVVFGLLGYLAFREETQDIITLNLPNDWSTIAVKVGLCIALFFTFPVMMFPVHEIVERMASLSMKFIEKAPTHPGLSRALVNMFRSVIVLVVALIAICIPGFGVFVSLVGSTVCAMLSFVFPALFHMRILTGDITCFQKGVDIFLVLAGVAFALYGSYTSIVGLFCNP